MVVSLSDIGKRFNRDWIFRHVNYNFEGGKSYAITGPNGSGKSTLLQAIAGSLHLSEGKLEYSDEPGSPAIEPENLYQYISIAAPYLELIEEMTAREFLHFHGQFKSLLSSVSVETILAEIGLENAMDKQVRYFSSGMKQRLKLAQAVFSDVPVLLLDEPCTNLDKPGYELYHSLIDKYCLNKLIIVSSNDALEMDFCSEKLNIVDYK
ncbi:MAG: ATP-binding cassette protein [Sediminibacterium sp.]|nr:ATP-binding cassette protein [Sediminibacterium sp.]